MSYADSYNTACLLGSGAFAEVYLCTAKPHGSKYAVKMIKNAEPNVDIEIDILKGVNHENIVRLFDVFHEGSTIYMVQELISGGEMFDYIIDKGTYSEADACKAFGMILEGLNYLHERQIVHRDLKPENILLSEKTENAVIKIADFGLAKVISEQGMTATTCGTPGYVAPEVLRQEKYGLAVDVWAAGVILYIMVSGYEPFYDDNETQMFKNIMSGNYAFPKDLFSGVSQEIISVIKRILVVQPEKRPSTADCLEDPWLKEYNEAKNAKQLDVARANLAKIQAKKKFKGALIAVRLGEKMKETLKNSVSSFKGITKEAVSEDNQIIKDNETNSEEAAAPVTREANAPPEEELPGQVPVE